MKLPSAETLREQIASDPDDEPTAGPVEAPEAALTSKKRLIRYTPGLNGTEFMGMLRENELRDGFYGPGYDWTQGPYVLASDADAELDRQRAEIERLREVLERWTQDGRLQTFEDRERFRAEVRKVLSVEGASAHETSDWQSIETAPKDGRWILLGSAHCCCVGYYRSDVASWLDQRNQIRDPTHWMPLPKPPACQIVAYSCAKKAQGSSACKDWCGDDRRCVAARFAQNG